MTAGLRNVHEVIRMKEGLFSFVVRTPPVLCCALNVLYCRTVPSTLVCLVVVLRCIALSCLVLSCVAFVECVEDFSEGRYYLQKIDVKNSRWVL